MTCHGGDDVQCMRVHSEHGMIGASSYAKVNMSEPESRKIQIVVIVRLPGLGSVGQDWLLVLFSY